MQKLINLLSGLFLIVVFIMSIVFSYFNSTPVTIRFGTWEIADLAVSIWIIGAFVCGGSLGLILGLRFFKGIKTKNEVRQLNKKLAQAKTEIQQLRTLTMKDLS